MDWTKTKAIAARLATTDSAAAELAFFLTLSLVPMVAVAIALVSQALPVDLSAPIEAVLQDMLPLELHVGAGDVVGWARSSGSQGWLTAGFVMAVWTSFRFVSLCLRLLGSLVDAAGHPPLEVRHPAARALLVLLLWLVTLAAAALLLLVAPFINAGLLELPLGSALWRATVLTLPAVLTAGCLFAAIYCTYRAVIGKRVGQSRVVLAALLASCGWLAVSRGFSLAVPLLWKATLVYGTLGSVVLFLMWAYLTAWILLLGGLLVASSKRRQLPAPGQARVALAVP